MTIEEIRNRAPEGATHYDDSGDYWIIKNNYEAYFTDGSRWIRYAFPVQIDIDSGYIKPL